MVNQRMISPARSRERGQTMVLVALAMVSLLAMAALAIDVVTLYVARSEAQRAADAAALAGAKAFVDSSLTTDPTNPALQRLAQNMATAAIDAIVQQNKISGKPPVLASPPAFNFAQQGDPQVTLTLQRTNLPIFFARIWGGGLASVTASATAEAYNPSNSQTLTGNYVPIAPKCVKPLLVPNQPPNSPGFIDPVSGVVTPGIAGQAITLIPGCKAGGKKGGCNPNTNQGNYLPAGVTSNPANLCPSCLGPSSFEQSIACCDFNIYSCGGSTPNTTVDLTMTPSQLRNQANNGVSCLVNQPSQDTIYYPLPPGTGPMQITAGSGPQSGDLVTTSAAIATIPIYDQNTLNSGNGQATVIGFMQVFIQDVNNQGNITATVLNVAGCGNSPNSTVMPVSGGGVSPIPVRLIRN